jgi:hypothetical protein
MSKANRDNRVYEPRSIKRNRRTNARLGQLDDQIVEALRACHPQSVRHVFYLMTDPRLPEPVEKTEEGVNLVKRRLKVLRRSGRVPYAWVEDMSRRGYHVATYGDSAEFLRSVASLYRADLWQQTPYYVEVWCESRSIAGVIMGTCRELAVSLYPAGGNTSISFAYQAACNINDRHDGRTVVVFYVGDYDQAGVIIDRKVEEELRLHLDPDVNLKFVRVAVTAEQIEQHDLPAKPRKESDRRSPEVARTVEAEAMPPPLLNKLLRDNIEALLPPRALLAARAAEDSERQLLTELADRLAS